MIRRLLGIVLPACCVYFPALEKAIHAKPSFFRSRGLWSVVMWMMCLRLIRPFPRACLFNGQEKVVQVRLSSAAFSLFLLQPIREHLSSCTQLLGMFNLHKDVVPASRL